MEKRVKISEWAKSEIPTPTDSENAETYWESDSEGNDDSAKLPPGISEINPFEGRGILYEDLDALSSGLSSKSKDFFVPGKVDTVYLDVKNMKFVSKDTYIKSKLSDS